MNYETMKQWLEALENIVKYVPIREQPLLDEVIDASESLRQAIADVEKQERGEPVAKVCHDLEQHIGWNPNAKVNEFPEGMPLYARPQSKRKPLTMFDTEELAKQCRVEWTNDVHRLCELAADHSIKGNT